MSGSNDILFEKAGIILNKLNEYNENEKNKIELDELHNEYVQETKPIEETIPETVFSPTVTPPKISFAINAAK